MLICSPGVYNLGEVLNLLIVADCGVCDMCVSRDHLGVRDAPLGV